VENICIKQRYEFMDENKSINEFGKFGLIDHLTRNFKSSARSVVGIGDDAAAADNGNNLTLVTTDLMLEGIHFNLIYTPLRHLGYKAVIRGISDIIAMNGTPVQVLIGLGISSRFSVSQLDEIYDGIALACNKYSVDLAGGDITSSLTGLTISVTATGTVDRNKIVRRNGALENDIICVTGDFGASYMGLQLLERERRLFVKEKVQQPDLSGYEYIVGRQLRPDIPVKVQEQLELAGIVPTSMIDVSDGLASDLLHICRDSGTGCRIYEDKIPIDYETSKAAEEFRIDPLIAALNGGEDYELLFTVPLGNYEKIKDITSIKVIGHITTSETGSYLVGENGTEIELKAQGWGSAK
jgi:thiamine-monophosphate kinase